ncbi:hypothetical protein EAG_14687 [Camponotus floridanus]|uniref:Uncharacterized protein n=1 Tax=Camponotus floridanus TaxID=104421 RepID=E2A921_CAMFO|nr:hypothetical protein EAG_14687 [Camponotus floridanus]
MFRMLDEEWTSLAPNRRDHRPYRGSCSENENFYGGKSIIFCVPARFFEKKAIDVDVQLYVQREMCEYFEMDLCQNVGFATVSVDDLLNGIAKQMRERNELSEHLSDLYKQQIISRSATGTYNLLDENFRNTAATISLYIRISCLGKCLVTEITRIESDMYGAFCARKESDKEQYLARQLTPDELQSGHRDVKDLPRIPRGRLVCRCEELRKKDLPADLAEKERKRLKNLLHEILYQKSLFGFGLSSKTSFYYFLTLQKGNEEFDNILLAKVGTITIIVSRGTIKLRNWIYIV